MDQQVLECLRATLSPDDNLRKSAEEQLKGLFQVPEGGLSLARILCSQDVEVFQRQDWRLYSAGVLLQQYISRHWAYVSNTFEEPVTSYPVKDQIRPIVFQGLSDPQRKVRAGAAFAISTIAKFDWPEDYPTLLTDLTALLRDANPNAVDGAMKVITEFVREELSEDQLLPVVGDLVPALIAILGNPQLHSPSTRASTVHVYRQVLRMLETVRAEHPQAVKSALEQMTPIWLDAFQQLLAQDPASEVQASWESIGIRIELFRTLTLYQSTFASYLLPNLAQWLALSNHTLHTLQPLFQTYYLSSDPSAPEPPSPTTDAGFQTAKLNLDDLGCAVFDFLVAAVRVKKAKLLLVIGEGPSETSTELLKDMIQGVLGWTRVTRENEEEWMVDVNAFVMDEDEEAEQYGLRVAGFDLVGSLVDKYPDAVIQILQDTTIRIVHDSATARSAGDPDWWKPLESVLALLGGIGDDIRNIIEDDEEKTEKRFDVKQLFDEVIPGLLGQSETPFLQGRAYLFASQYVSLLPEELAGQYLAAAVNAMEMDNVAIPVKISAVRTVKNFCRFVDASVISPHSRKIVTLFFPLLQEATGETLYLILETMRAILALDKELLDPASIAEVGNQVFEIWLKYSMDPVLTAITEELFESLSTLSPLLVASLVSAFSPKIAQAIADPVTDDTLHIPAEAIQLANSLIRTRGGPIEPDYIGNITIAVLTCLKASDDMDVIQHGMIHLTLVVRKDAEKLIQLQDQSGTNGITQIFNLLARFLSPTFSESGGIFVGELIMHLFRKAGGAIGPILPDLLRAIVERLAVAKLPSFITSQVLPFAYLFGTEYTISTMDLLEGINAGGKNGLEVVLGCWSEVCDSINGSWNIRVSDMGMSKLFRLNDPRIARVVVKGDLIISETNRNTIMTRSKAKTNPDQFTQTAFPVKALKLILKDVQSVEAGTKGGKGKGKAVEDFEIEEDDGNDEWDDDDPLGDAEVGEFDYLSSWLDDGGHREDAQDDDEDLRTDPLAQIDIGQYLTDLLRGCYASNENGIHEMIGSLTDEEKGILRKVLTI